MKLNDCEMKELEELRDCLLLSARDGLPINPPLAAACGKKLDHLIERVKEAAGPSLLERLLAPFPPKVEKLALTDSDYGWKQFQEDGLLWWINRQLHAFNRSIALVVEEDGRISEAIPICSVARGFTEEDESEGYDRIDALLSKEFGK